MATFEVLMPVAKIRLEDIEQRVLDEFDDFLDKDPTPSWLSRGTRRAVVFVEADSVPRVVAWLKAHGVDFLA